MFYYEPETSEKVNFRNNYHNYYCLDYAKIYLGWPTDLLPHEFCLDSIYYPRKNKINFAGTLSMHGECENFSNFKSLINACKKKRIPFYHNNPWKSPLTRSELIKYVRDSIVAVDIRSKKHLSQGLVTCRVFKNISYGHLGLTNSQHIYNALEGNCIYAEDGSQLLDQGLSNRFNFKFIRDAMIYVSENHTYINRVNNLLEVL